jgi:hypothetical protein
VKMLINVPQFGPAAGHDHAWRPPVSKLPA